MAEDVIVQKLQGYRGAWRRSEVIRTTKNGNILMSDYGHHPKEIRPTLEAIRSKYPEKKLIVAFQPHQYSRTRELLGEFAHAFESADQVFVPNIYFSRDKEEDVAFMTVERFVGAIVLPLGQITAGTGLDSAKEWLESYDRTHPNSAILLLLGA